MDFDSNPLDIGELASDLSMSFASDPVTSQKPALTLSLSADNNRMKSENTASIFGMSFDTSPVTIEGPSTSHEFANKYIGEEESPVVKVTVTEPAALVESSGDEQIIGCKAKAPRTTTPDNDPNSISMNHYERLIEELKCPGCAHPMRAPIRLCVTGHSICNMCTVILDSCPLCKETFTEIRSLTLEALTSKAYFRCMNASAGCTVRLQIDLLKWHEKQCTFKTVKCFMGRVWGNCPWSGREACWKEHLESLHSDKIFNTNEAELQWEMGEKMPTLSGYYVFQLYGDMFNFYHIYDKDRVLWTMACTSTVREKKLIYTYDVEIYNPEDETIVITQRFPCHSEFDMDILQEGTCVSVPFGDLMRFVGPDKILFYRVRLNKVKRTTSMRKSKSMSVDLTDKPSRPHPTNFLMTTIEGVNLKSVPANIIVTRKIEDLTISEMAESESGTGENNKNEETSKSDEDNDRDPEFEALLDMKFGTPQLNFNRKYLHEASSSSPESNSSRESRIVDSEIFRRKSSKFEPAVGNKMKMRRVTSSLRKSLKSLKTDFELKTFGKKSPDGKP